MPICWNPDEALVEVAVGDRVQAIVVSTSGGLTLSRRLAGATASDRQFEDAFHSGLPVEGKVERQIKGGYEVRLGRQRAFCPKLTLLSKIESGIESTRPTITGLSHQKNIGHKINDDTPHTRPKTVCCQWVRIASRQSVPSSPASRRCVIQPMPCPSNVNNTNRALNIMLIGARSDEFCESARFEALYLSLPATPWVRVLDTDHFFGTALDDLAQACRDAIAWAVRCGGTSRRKCTS